MKVSHLLSGILLCLTAVSSIANTHEANTLREYARKHYNACDLQALAKELVEGKMKVQFVEDEEAQYNYYIVTNQGYNVDAVRGATCRFINKNQCYLYWGNVANIALITERSAPRFPVSALDTTPHYMLAPNITCNKLKL